MLDNHGFDLWAGHYDEAVQQAEDNHQYPFAGYTGVMNAIYGTILQHAPVTVFDIGFGTAQLTSRLYEAGNTITGIDFSLEMVRIALSKMPKATLLQWNFSLGIPPQLRGESFDFIVSTYALHHLTDDAKVHFITSLLDLVKPKGSILIGDVCFPTRSELLACQASCGGAWDEDEIYLVFSELHARLGASCKLRFHAFSFCAGIVEISPL